MRSFADALTAIEAEETQIAEHKIPLQQLVIEKEMLRAGEQAFAMTPMGLERLCNLFEHQPKVPSTYLNSLPTPLFNDTVRLHQQEGIAGDGTVSLFVRGQELVGIDRGDLARLWGHEVMQAVAEGLGGREDELEVTRFETVGESFRCDVITHRAERQVRRGDLVIGGVHIDHSLTGDYATQVEGYFYRVICTNGAIHRECLGARRIPRTRRLPASDPRARGQQREQVKRLTAGALNMLSTRFQGLERLTTERADFVPLADNWLRRSRLSPDRLMPLLTRAYGEEGGGGTVYEVMNAFTRVGTHATELSPRMRDTLARLGGLLAFGHSRLCPRCWSLIAASN